jgi:elongation factor G
MLLTSLGRVRNIGIIAHIDAGKTTATERFLYCAGKTHKIGEVHDGTAVMDFRPDERQRGITISAAATTFLWNQHQINLIDTPGHVDFTAEVERSLRVLDGAVVIFSGVEGVEPQSETVWRQADRYHVPRLAFINKLDRAGADHVRVLDQIEAKFNVRAAFLNLPHGVERGLDGVIDLIQERWLVMESGLHGRAIDSREIPADSIEAAGDARDRLIEKAAECVGWLEDAYLAGTPISTEDLQKAIRQATLAGKFVPVLCGAALRDQGIQPVLDAVCAYLPSPLDRPPARGTDPETGGQAERPLKMEAPFSALVFKVVASPSTDFYWLRVYSGSLSTEDRCYQPRSKTRMRLRRLLRLHADRTEAVERAECGDIVAVPGLKDVITGDTLCDPQHPITYEPIHFPQTVVSMAVEAQTSAERERLFEVVRRIMREDPTLTAGSDEETGEMILSGMGELHLEILHDRMQREFGVDARFSKPRVSYRETVVAAISASGDFEKRIGDVQVSGRAVVEIAPRPREAGDRSLPPVELDISAVDEALTTAMRREAINILDNNCVSGGLKGYPLHDVRVRLLEFRTNDPPDPLVPLNAAVTLALRNAVARAGTAVLEPVMTLEVRVPDDSLGQVLKDLDARRAEIRDTELAGNVAVVRGVVPLAKMFGYSTQLRSLTQGRGSFSMEPYDYQPVRSN